MPKQTEVYMTPQADEANKGWRHLVKHCCELYEKFKQSAYRKKKLEEIDESVKAYEQERKRTAEMWDGESDITLPLTTISCDNLEPRLVAGLVGKKPYIYFEMENEQKQDQPTEITETWFNNELEDVVKIEAAAGDVVHQLMQEGTVFVLPSYDLDEVTRKDFVLEDEFMAEVERNYRGDIAAIEAIMQDMIANGQQFVGGVLMGPDGPVLRDITDTAFEGGRLDIVPFNDVFIPDVADHWEKTPVIRKVYPTYAELVQAQESGKPGYMNIGPWLCDEAEGTDIDQDNLTSAQLMDSVKESGKKTIECIECYVSYIYRDDDTITESDEKQADDYAEERLVATITEGSGILIRLMPLRELNFKNEHLVKRIRLFPRKGKAYGTSIYSKMKAIQDGASKTFNMAINVAEVTMIPWFFYTDVTGLSKNKGADGKPGLKLTPGMGVKVDSVDGLYFPKFPVNPDHFINWINLWVSFWERLLSIGDLQIGRQGENNRTATETLAVIQEGNVKHNYQAQSIKEDFLSVVRTIYDLYYQNMPFDKTFLWNGERVPLPRSLMRRPYKFRLTGSTDLSNKLIERKEKETFYQLTAADANVNPVKRAEELVKAYGHTDTSEWISPQIAAIVQQIMMVPGAQELVTKTLQEAQQIAQAMQQGQGAQQPMQAVQ